MNIVVFEDSIQDTLRLKKILKNHETMFFKSLSKGKDLNQADLILLDMHLENGEKGWELLAQAHKIEAPIVVMTSFGEIKSAVKALQLGAKSYLEKPLQWEDLSPFLTLNLKTNWENICFQSNSPCATLVEELNLLAPGNHTLFLHGPSGSGKEVFAQSIHLNSPRASENFVAINCGSLQGNLLESELFGHQKGAFTGASQNAVGKIQHANHGTLFLDEIGELSLSSQTRLLRVIQEKKITPVGSRDEIPVDFRLLCATHKDLKAMVSKGLFREDLYYRIAVFTLNIPSLHSRIMDLAMLAQKIWAQFSSKTKLSQADISILKKYTWPGNIRQLKNILEQYSVYQKLGRPIGHLIPAPETSHLSLKQKHKLEQAQEFHKVLAKCGNNKSRAAKELGLPRGTFVYKLKKLQLD